MKSDKPFHKSFICGMVLFVLIYFLCLLIYFKTQEFYFIQYYRIVFVAFLPAVFAGIWSFFSKKNWTWIRFGIVTIIFCPICIVILGLCADYLPLEGFALPTITFSSKIPSSWTIEVGSPITDMAKKPIGHQLLMNNADRRREIWVEASLSHDDFDTNVTFNKTLITQRIAASGFQIEKNKFTVNVENGRKVAFWHLLVKKNDITREILCYGWIQKQFFVSCEAMGQNVEITNDKEIADIISSIVVK
jgi:hypothetical protein